jgi:WD40 repeat protein
MATTDSRVQIRAAETGDVASVLSGHRDQVNCLAFSPGEQLLATGSSDKTIKLWDWASGEERFAFTGHADEVLALAFAPDGKTLASAGKDKTIRLWNAVTGQELAAFPGHDGTIRALAFAPNGRLVSGGDDQMIRVWDPATQKELTRLEAHTRAVRALAFSAHGVLASASDDGTIKLWEPDLAKERLTLKGHAHEVLALAFTPSGRILVSGSADKSVRVWDTGTGQARAVLNGHKDAVTALALHPQGQHLLSGSLDTMLMRWQGARGKVAILDQGARKTDKKLRAAEAQELLDMKVRSAASVEDVTAAVVSGTADKPRHWLVAAGILILGVSLSFAGLGLYVRRKRRTQKILPHHVAPDRPTESTDPPRFIIFACSGCGKTLKVKAEWAGKKGKCSRCGNESLVPALPVEIASSAPTPVAETKGRWLPRWIGAPAALLLIGLITAMWYGMAAGSPAPTKGVSRDYHQSFKGAPADAPSFEPFGPDAEQCVKFEPDGLRITLPAGYNGERGAVGLATHIAAHGDFEITTNFEVLAEPTTADAGKNDTRFSIMAGFESPKQDVARVTRGVRADSGPQFVAWSALWDAQQGKNKNHYGSRPTSAKTGRLRLVRSGSIVSFFVAEGLDNEFVLLQEYPFTEADVRNLSLVGSTSGPKAGLDVRFWDFHVRANELFGVPAAAANGSGERNWPAAGGMLFLTVAVCVSLGAWLFARQPRPAGSAAPTRWLSAKLSPISKTIPRWSPHALWLAALVLLAILSSQLVLGLSRPPEDAEATARLAEVFSDDLRSSEVKSDLLRTVGDGVVPEAGGVRVTLSAGEQHPPSGIRTTGLTVHGDFEITMGYEILKADRPNTGYGVGTSLYAQIDEETKNAFSFARRILPDGREYFMTHGLTLVNGNRQQQIKRFPTTATAGRLRLKRVGSVVHYQVAEGDDEQFTDLHQLEVGSDDIHCIQIGGHSGGSESGLDMRLRDFTVKAEELPGVPQAGARSAWSKAMLMVMEFLGLLVVLSIAVSLSPPRQARMPARLPTQTPDTAFQAGLSRIMRGLSGPRKWWLAGSLAFVVFVVVVAWPLLLLRPKPLAVFDITLGSQDVPGVEESGFSLPERDQDGEPFRWTDGNARLIVPIDTKNPPQAIALRIYVFRPPQVKRAPLKIVVNGRELFNRNIPLWKWENTFDLRGMQLGDQLLLDIVSDTFVPRGIMDKGTNTDDRSLGVQVRSVRLLANYPETVQGKR